MWTVSSASVLQKTCEQSLITSALYQTFPDDELVQLNEPRKACTLALLLSLATLGRCTNCTLGSCHERKWCVHKRDISHSCWCADLSSFGSRV